MRAIWNLVSALLLSFVARSDRLLHLRATPEDRVNREIYTFRASLFFTTAGVPLLFSLQASAISMAVTTVTQGVCDPLVVPPTVEELGSGFAFGEAIRTNAGVDTNNFLVCAGTGNSSGVDVVVGIENLTGIAFSSVWYVANPETSFTNVDGTVNGGLALKIDHDGVNTPLLSAACSGCSTTDTILSPGEGWAFIIKNYSNTLGLPADAIMTPGVPDGSGGPSSGSIIAIPVPEPTSMALVALGLLGLAGHGSRSDRSLPREVLPPA